MSDSFYKVLGVAESATQDEIKKAYRKLAKQYHPDKNKGDAKAEAKFKEISEAYDIIGDETKRGQYDQMRKAGFFSNMGGAGGPSGAQWSGQRPAGGGGGVHGFSFDDLGGFDNIFENLFGGGRGRPQQGSGSHGFGFDRGAQQVRGQDISATLTIPFELAARGGNQTFSFARSGDCTHCHGIGAEPGTGFHVCAHCEGRGTVTLAQGGFGIQRTCPECKGQGEIPDAPCKVCRGTGEMSETRRLTVKIPPGIDSGQTIRLRGEGEQVSGASGDLLLQVHVSPHAQFRREGGKIISDYEADLETLVLGGEISVPALDGPVRLRVPAGTQPGTVFRLKDKGLYHKNNARGDAHVTIKAKIPKNLTDDQKDKFKAFVESLK